MITVSVFYPRDGGDKFDYDYYFSKHADLVMEKLRPRKMVGLEVERGIGSMEGGEAPFYVIAHLRFETEEDFRNAFGEVGDDIVADIPNYTDVAPVIQVSEHVKAL